MESIHRERWNGFASTVVVVIILEYFFAVLANDEKHRPATKRAMQREYGMKCTGNVVVVQGVPTVANYRTSSARPCV